MKFWLVLFLGPRVGIRLWRTDRERSGRLLATLADWEMELLTERNCGRFFGW